MTQPEKLSASERARKRLFDKYTPEQRSERATKMSRARHSKLTPQEKSELGRKIVASRWEKYKKQKAELSTDQK